LLGGVGAGDVDESLPFGLGAAKERRFVGGGDGGEGKGVGVGGGIDVDGEGAGSESEGGFVFADLGLGRFRDAVGEQVKMRTFLTNALLWKLDESKFLVAEIRADGPCDA
jgi:hypothetical protein